MTISLSIRNPSETPSKSTTASLAYRHRPLLADAQLPDGHPTFPYRVAEELPVTRAQSPRCQKRPHARLVEHPWRGKIAGTQGSPSTRPKADMKLLYQSA